MAKFATLFAVAMVAVIGLAAALPAGQPEQSPESRFFWLFPGAMPWIPVNIPTRPPAATTAAPPPAGGSGSGGESGSGSGGESGSGSGSDPPAENTDGAAAPDPEE